MTDTRQSIRAPWARKRLDANHVLIHDSDGMTVVSRMIAEPGTASEAASTLIEAAPDLLAALKSLWEARGDAQWKAALAAIAKAEGRA